MGWLQDISSALRNLWNGVSLLHEDSPEEQVDELDLSPTLQSGAAPNLSQE